MTDDVPRNAPPGEAPPPAATPAGAGPEAAKATTATDDETRKLRADLEQARRERDDALGKMQRALADFDNYRKRSRGEAQAAREKAKEDVLRALLDVLDNFDRALAHPEDAAGPALIHRQLTALLEREGLERITAVGEAFDPLRHEAVARVPTKDAKEGVVVEEVARGYAAHGKVLRPARVKVAAPPA